MSTWIEIGPITDVPRAGARVVSSSSSNGGSMTEGSIAIFRTSDDHIFALRNRCPHKGGPLSEGIVHGHRVACPLHNWNIDLESGNAVAPDIGCAPKIPTRIENGTIWLQLTPHLQPA